MTITSTAVRPDQAIDALAEAVVAAKGSDALEPVVVIVPGNTCGVMARRALGRTGGVVGVDMRTLDRLAEQIAGPGLATERRSPASTPVVDLAVGAVLADRPGSYEPVRDHPSTIVALRTAHQELRRAGPAAADALAARSRRGREVVRVSRAVTARLKSRWYDEADLFERATAAVVAGEPIPVQHLVVHLPSGVRGLPVEFLRVLGGRVDVHLVVTLAGSAEADDVDADVRWLLAELGQPPPARVAAPSAAPNRIVSTTDADDEVRIALRTVVDAARAGTPFERMAVLWPTHRPYARLVEHHLGAAGIPWNGRPGTAVSERLVPRFLLDLLDVDRRGLRRRDLFALLADVPARGDDGRFLPTAEWERASREAGVARDDDWDRRLAALAGSERYGIAAAELAGFVDDLRAELGRPAATRRWWDWADWCDQQLERWLGRPTLDRLPESEYRALEALERALERLRHLDPVGDPVTRHGFRTTLEAELDDMPGREGRVGDGVSVGSLAGAEGLDVDVVVVLGAAEGSMPPIPTGDPLMSDADREAIGLPTAAQRSARLRRNLLGVLITSDATITVPRGDLRSTSSNPPSRWIAPWIDEPRTHVVASHTAGLTATEFPASAAEHRLRARYGHVAAGGSVETTAGAASDSVLQRGIALRQARASADFTVYDGDLGAVEVPVLDGVVSPSRLESWAACPHGYFVRYLLGIKPIDEPDEVISITAVDRGSATHDALDEFHRAVIAGELPQPTASGWADEHRRALAEIFDRVCARTEGRGRAGRPAYWAVEQDRMRDDLLVWLDHDSELVVERDARVLASEHDFGADGAEVAIDLPDGRHLRLEGMIDRVDRCADGSLVVTDHKTGSDQRYRGLSDDDPTLGGTVFQLPTYAAAAAAMTGDDDEPVRAEYGMFAKAKYARIGYELTPEIWEHVGADLADVVAGIEQGVFPPTPERPGWRMFVPCEYCEPDHLGTGERWSEWSRKRHDHRIARWFAPPAADEDEAES